MTLLTHTQTHTDTHPVTALFHNTPASTESPEIPLLPVTDPSLLVKTTTSHRSELQFSTFRQTDNWSQTQIMMSIISTTANRKLIFSHLQQTTHDENMNAYKHSTGHFPWTALYLGNNCAATCCCRTLWTAAEVQGGGLSCEGRAAQGPRHMTPWSRTALVSSLRQCSLTQLLHRTQRWASARTL